MNAHDRPRLGVVGAGWWASTVHIPSLAEYPGADLVAVCDADRDRAVHVAGEHGVREVFSDVEELVTSGLVDGLVVATPHATHHPIARRAIDAGLHVLIEKTMAVTAEDAWDLVVAARDRGVELAVGYTYQHTSTASRARQWLREGEIGELIQVVAEFSSGAGGLYAAAEEPAPDPADPGVPHPSTYAAGLGGGQAHTQATHVMGLVCWQAERDVADVHAFMDHGYGRRRITADVTDAATFRFSDGALGVLASTGTVPPGVPPRHRVRYHGTAGLLEYDMLAATARLFRPDGTELHHAVDSSEPAYPVRAVSRTFADLIAGRGPNLAPGRWAATAVAFLDAAHRSARTGQIERPAAPPSQVAPPAWR